MSGTFLVEAAISVVAFFWVVLPIGVFAAAMLVSRRSPASGDPDGVRLCPGSDPTDPASKPCWVTPDQEYCQRHTPASTI